MEMYQEKQRFLRYWWFIAIVVVALVFVPQLLGDIIPIKNQGRGYEGLFAVVVMLVMFWLFSLQTQIDTEGISLKFSPFHLKDKQIKWKEVKQARITTYSALKEFGGWGPGKGWKKSKVAYNVWGTTGLELTLNNGDIIMIGTNNKEQLTEYLLQLKYKNHIEAIAF
jgi:hypothetical protein